MKFLGIDLHTNCFTVAIPIRSLPTTIWDRAPSLRVFRARHSRASPKNGHTLQRGEENGAADLLTDIIPPMSKRTRRGRGSMAASGGRPRLPSLHSTGKDPVAKAGNFPVSFSGKPVGEFREFRLT